MFGSCEDVDDETDDETNDTKAREHHPAYVLLVLQEGLLHIPLFRNFFLSFLKEIYSFKKMPFVRSFKGHA